MPIWLDIKPKKQSHFESIAEYFKMKQINFNFEKQVMRMCIVSTYEIEYVSINVFWKGNLLLDI